MTLLELCEPLFQHVCQLNHSARKGATYDFMVVRKEVEDQLADLRNRSSADPSVAGVYDEKTELSVIFFVDHLIATSPSLPFAHEWGDNRIAYERSPAVMTGDSDFFAYFDQALAERSEAATQRLAIYYTMVGLGMTGEYADRPDVLRRKMMEATRRLAPIMDVKTTARICPDAEEHTNTDDLVQPPVRPPVLIAIAVAGLMIIFFGAFVALYHDAIGKLNDNLKSIQSTSERILSDGGGSGGASADPRRAPTSRASS